jgi:CDP-diacylglycerol pyrophosphatase
MFLTQALDGTIPANAKSRGLDDYGVLVTKALNGKFIVLVSPNSPEAAFTKWKCT